MPAFPEIIVKKIEKDENVLTYNCFYCFNFCVADKIQPSLVGDMKRTFFKILACGSILAAVNSINALADTTIYYDGNYATYNGFALQMTNGVEVGNEITVTPGNYWSMDDFQIEYYAPGNLSANVGVEVQFYLNNGPSHITYSDPGSLFFSSGWTYGLLAGNGAYTIDYNSSELAGGWNTGVVPGYYIPGDFTFTVTFTNLDDSDVVEMPLANSQSTAYSTSYGDYWVNDNGTWELETNAAPANFLVDITGVPEPSTLGLAAVGGLLLMGIKRLRGNP